MAEAVTARVARMPLSRVHRLERSVVIIYRHER
jgi:hypothetical protein